MTGPLVIVGGDAAGMSCAAEARRCDPERVIVVLERSGHVSYAACGLPYWLGGVIPDRDDLVAHTPEYFRERRRIDVRLHTEVVDVDPEARRVVTADGERVAYGDLVLATGARPVTPPVPGVETPGVLTLRDMDSGMAMARRLGGSDGGTALLVGSGPIGLEMAENLCRRGFRVHIVEREDRLVPSVHPDISRQVVAALEAGCASARTGADLQSLAEWDGRIRAVVDGVAADYDLVVVGTGIAPASELALAAGCLPGERDAVRVDRSGRTTVEGVWAAGDCATAWHRVLQRDVWAPLATTANRQGRVTGRAVCGRPARFPGVLGSWMSEAFGMGFGATGIDEDTAREAGFVPAAVTRTGRDRSGYIPGAREVTVRLVFDEPTGVVLGGQTAGGADVASRVHALAVVVAAGMTVEDLAGVDFGYAPPLSALRDPLELAAAAVVGDAP